MSWIKFGDLSLQHLLKGVEVCDKAPQNQEVYIDDMLVKSVKAKLHIDHLAESF